MLHRHYLRSLLFATLGLTILLLSSWSTLLAPQLVAYAHAFVIGSDPVDGSTVANAPRVVRIFFAAAISPASIAHVYTPDEHIVDATRSSISPSNPRELDTPLKNPDQLPQGGYTVRWTVLADGDGHTTQGVIGFNIGHSSTGLPGQVILGPSTSNILPQLSLLGILAIAWDWLVMAALALWIGILVMESVVLADGKQSLPLQWLCLATLFTGEIINFILRAALFIQTSNTSGIDPATIRELIVDTTYGHLWLVRIALIGMALVFLWWTTRSTRRQSIGMRNSASTRTRGKTRYTFVLLTLAGLILLTLALSEDVTQLAQAHASAVILVWLFLVAQGVWFGGAAYLGFVLLPLLPTFDPELHARSLVTVIQRYTPLIAGSIVVLLVSGLFLAETSLSSVQQFFTDPFGRALLVKIMLVAIMLLVSAYTLFFLTPQLRRQVMLLHGVDAEMAGRPTRQAALGRKERRLIITMRSLAYLGAGVLLCAAFMSFFAPPIVFPAIDYTNGSSTNTAPSTTNTQVIQTKHTGNLTVSLQVIPARVGYDNTVIVTLSDSNGNPITDAQVQININMVTMNMGTASATIKSGDSTYVAVFNKDESFSMPGLWDIALKIQRPNQPPVQVSFQVTLPG